MKSQSGTSPPPRSGLATASQRTAPAVDPRPTAGTAVAPASALATAMSPAVASEAHMAMPPAVASTPTSTPAQSAASPSTESIASGAPPPSMAAARTQLAAWIYPIRYAGRQPADGFVIRHGFQTENTWYNPGDWHTGEDWYALIGDTAGAEVVAVASGDVVYAGANYPGRVVIVRHAGNVFSMYGHLEPTLAVSEGLPVERGLLLGTVLRRGDETPNHLHFEIRSFLTADPVNGPAPRYGYRCGPTCPPGPGYWPIAAPELPSAVGWLNPTHVIARNTWSAPDAIGEAFVATQPVSPTLALWSNLDRNGTPSGPLGELAPTAGMRYQVLEWRSGPEQPPAPSAEGYSLWYRLALPDGRSAWAAALAPNAGDTGSDGKPSSVRFNLLPVATQ